MKLTSLASKPRFPPLGRIPACRLAPGLVVALSLVMLAACVSTETLEAGENPVTTTPIGQEREAVMSQSGDLDVTEAHCETLKTGVGVNRRAYFLETCKWQQSTAYRVCGQQPESVEYAFLEGRLIATMFSFMGGNESELQACIKVQALAEGYTDESPEMSRGEISRLSNAGLKTTITVGDTSVVRVFDTDLAPKVHWLRDKL